MAGLLVSVRSVQEAQAAWGAGASLIDVKEPARGSLGRADSDRVRAIRAALPAEAPMSQALGELVEWEPCQTQDDRIEGVAFRKLGLAGAGSDWARRWARIVEIEGISPAWIAVVYADWLRACAPKPSEVLHEAARQGCRGLLIDTWEKSVPSPLTAASPWVELVGEAHSLGFIVAFAGGLDERSIPSLAALQPELFAVRRAACAGGQRLAEIDPDRVASLAHLVAQFPTAIESREVPFIIRTTASAGSPRATPGAT